ncbi:MAG TPA: mechanosensitive ion channel family protein [Solirubrobacteraceae bacterium]|nr:mechanosensitive ion channel family protein [Solirubrobacteraceae bacterium]
MSLSLAVVADAAQWTRAAVILVVGLVLAQGLYAGVARAQARRGSDLRGARAFGRIVRVVVAIAAVIYALAQLGVRIGPLLAAAGVGGVALAFAVRSIFENFLAGVLILLRRPFRPGNEIVSEDHEGTVEDINLRAVVLRTYDGQRVFIPNGQILNAPLVNRTAFRVRRSELVVGVAYEADLGEAAAVIRGALAGADGVVDDPPPEALCTAFGESAVELCVRFWHGATIDQAWRARNAAVIAIKGALDEAGIAIPFPQLALRVPATTP